MLSKLMLIKRLEKSITTRFRGEVVKVGNPTRLEGVANLYCTDHLKSLCEQNQLDGIVFSSDLTDYFN
jgi:hypothetical protein